jgi:hypothetical protein
MNRRLLTSAQTDAQMTEHFEVTHYLDEQTGEWYEPPTPPEIPGWGDDDEDDDDPGPGGATT